MASSSGTGVRPGPPGGTLHAIRSSVILPWRESLLRAGSRVRSQFLWLTAAMIVAAGTPTSHSSSVPSASASGLVAEAMSHESGSLLAFQFSDAPARRWRETHPSLLPHSFVATPTSVTTWPFTAMSRNSRKVQPAGITTPCWVQ